MKRCGWLNEDPLYIAYHDEEWGVPLRDPNMLFEALLLEGAQAGLSWYVILRKRERYRHVFKAFDPAAMARLNARSVTRLMADPGIVRHRGKIQAFIDNAKCYLAMTERDVDFSNLLWDFVGGTPIQNRWKKPDQVPGNTKISDAMSKALKGEGFRFVGSTTCYAFMQATGMVNDHVTTCFRHAEVTMQHK